MTPLLTNIKDKIQWKEIAFIMLITSLLPSIIVLPLIIYTFYNKKNATKTDYYAYFTCIALYIGAINATKLPAGDQLAYATAYSNIPEIGFKGALLYIYGLNGEYSSTSGISGEFMNGIYNFLGYYLTFGYYPLFICIYSFIELMLVFIGFYHFCQRINKNHIPLIMGPLILAFFYMYFNMMIQIQKQFMAQAIMMYVIGCYAQYGKMSIKLWIIAFISLFTHASMILFFPFFIFKILRDKLSQATFLIFAFFFASIIIMGPQIVNNTISDIESSSSAMSYSLKRVASSETANDGLSIDFFHPRTLITLIPILFVLYTKLWKNRKILNATETYILNIIFLLILSTIAMYNQKVAQYRYYLMTYMFLPIVTCFLSSKIKVRNNCMLFISLLSVGSFYIFFETIPWKYAPVTDIIIFPPTWLIFSNYNNL